MVSDWLDKVRSGNVRARAGAASSPRNRGSGVIASLNRRFSFGYQKSQERVSFAR